jgi:NADH-quinone oxidoreductase subunit C
MKAEDISALLSEKFGENILESKLDSLNPWSVVAPPAVVDVCQFLKADKRLLFDHLELLAGVDFKDRIEVVYIVCSMVLHHRYTLKCRLLRENPIVPTVESIWRAANWHERETYDMFGVVFSGHSDLRRILCPDDWEGYPLRKDYKFPDRYNHMPV